MIKSWSIDDAEGIEGNVHLPKEDTERNDINTHIFHNYISVTHPNSGGNIDLRFVHKNTVIIESVIIDKIN